MIIIVMMMFMIIIMLTVVMFMMVMMISLIIIGMMMIGERGWGRGRRTSVVLCWNASLYVHIFSNHSGARLELGRH